MLNYLRRVQLPNYSSHLFLLTRVCSRIFVFEICSAKSLRKTSILTFPPQRYDPSAAATSRQVTLHRRAMTVVTIRICEPAVETRQLPHA